MEQRSVTIHDVAAGAGVSTATVSRTLNEPWRVSEHTRDKVNACVAQLGYKPNLRARLLARGGSNALCFLLSNRPFLHSVHAGVLQGAAAEAEARKIQIVYAACSYQPTTPETEIKLPGMLGARGLIDGVIVAGTNYPNLLSALSALELPHVVFGTNLVTEDDARAANAVYTDDEHGGSLATEHLISLGHRSIVFVGDVSLPWYRRRWSGYNTAMRRAGLMPRPPVGCFDGSELEMGRQAVDMLCNAGEAFTALVVGGDMGALGAMRALRSRGIVVPGRVSVVGFNDEEAAEIAEPPLTTVHLPTEDAGARCVQLLEAMASGSTEQAAAVVLDVTLTRRQSAARIDNTI